MSVTAQDFIDAIRAFGRGDPSSALSEMFVLPNVKLGQFLDAKIQFGRTEQVLDSIVATLEDPTAITDFATQLNEPEDVISAALSRAIERIGSNFGLNRRPAVVSKGLVLVFRSSPPSRPISVPAGKKFFAPTLNQEYAATDTVNITSMTFDAILNKFVSAVPVQSVNTGLSTVAAAGQISVIRESITDIEGVTNEEPVTGGRDEESDRDFSSRIKTALSASNIGTKSGYRLLLLSLDDIKDASIVGAGDPLMARDLGDGGSVDAYITDTIPVQISETSLLGVNTVDLSGVGAGPWVFTGSRQPLINNVDLISPPADFITKDSTVFAGSVRAKDTIEFVADPTGSTITYFVNDNVNRTQVFLDDPERKILGSDVLVKEAITVLVNIVFRLVVSSGFSKSVVQANVQNAVTQLISTLGIGVGLEQSDVLRVITNVTGVDRVDLPMTRFDRGVAGQLNVIPANANEVLRVGSVVVNL